MREVPNNSVMESVARNPNVLDVSGFREKEKAFLTGKFQSDIASSGKIIDWNWCSGADQAKNLQDYSAYLQEKLLVFEELKYDYVKKTSSNETGRLRRLTVSDGLLNHVTVLQRQIKALLKCKVWLQNV